MLRLLDAEVTDAPMVVEEATLMREAQAMVHEGYLDILRLNPSE